MMEGHVDTTGAALIVLDFQQGVIDAAVPSRDAPALVSRTAQAINGARQVGIPVIFVTTWFRAGYPDVSTRNKHFEKVKQAGRLQEGSDGTEIHPSLDVREADPIVAKRRVGAFSHTDISTILSAMDVRTLVICGVATSGAVLSTVRYAADNDYVLVVLEDCCADPEPAVHDYLTAKILPSQAEVVSLQEFLLDIGAST